MTGPLRRRDVPPSATPLREAAPAAPVEPGVSPAVPVETALTGPHPATWRRCFPAREISVPEARDWARALLSGRVPAALLDDALLLLSEVVTNAVTHSDSARAPHGRVVVHITRTSTAVRVEVADAGSATTAPAVRTPTVDDDGGRGLWLVDLIAAEWGCRHEETGGSVWFRLTE